MKSRKKDIHRGQALQAVVTNSNMSVTVVTKKAGFSRRTYYNHIADLSLSFDILLIYGKVLKHDFSTEFPEILASTVEEPEELYGEPKTLEDAIKQRDSWKEKYYAISEKYQKLLEEKLK